MPLTITVLKPCRVLRATAEGILDYQEIHRIAPALEEAAETLPDHDILFDTQRTQSILTATDLWHLAADLGQRTSSHHRKFAIVCAQDRVKLVLRWRLHSRKAVLLCGSSARPTRPGTGSGGRRS